MMLDQYDKAILRLLDQDGRIAYSTIARNLNISNTMVHQRVQRLQQLGIIKGVFMDLDDRALGYDYAAFTGITLEKDADSAMVIRELEAIPEVTECYYVTGPYTLYVRIVAKDHADLRRVLYERIDIIAGINKTESIVELGCAFKRNIVPQ